MPAKATGDEPLLPVAAVARNGAWLPAVDVRELPDEYIVLADLPGLKPGDVDVTSDDNILTIAGARPAAHGRRPFPSRTADRQLLRLLRLPDGCDELEAHIRGGVNEVRIPKRRAAFATQPPTQGGRWHARVAESSRHRRPAYGGADTLARRVPTMTSTP